MVHNGRMDTPPLIRVLDELRDQPLDKITDDQKAAVLERIQQREARDSVVDVARFTSAI